MRKKAEKLSLVIKKAETGITIYKYNFMLNERRGWTQVKVRSNGMTGRAKLFVTSFMDDPKFFTWMDYFLRRE